MTGVLAVLLESRYVGEIVRNRSNVLRLTYTSEARRAGMTPLSLSLPTDLGTVTGQAVGTYLWGLLPDADGALEAIARRHQADVGDPLSLLAAVGLDCAGAVQLCRPDDVERVIAREGALVPASDGDIEQRLAELAMDENAAWTMPTEHWSLGGSQNKLALRRRGGRWYEASGAEPTSHIIKPGVHRLEAQALVEHVTMRAAAVCGLDVAATEYLTFGTESAVVVRRFDRARPDARSGDLVRLHQEDLCQALGVREKYEEYGGPGAARIIRLLRDAAATPGEASRNVTGFVHGLVFNTVVAAGDAHARNYALLLDGDSVRLAPLYDVASSLAYELRPGARRVLSMSIDQEFAAEAVTPERWRRFAADNDLDDRPVLDLVRQVAAIVPDAMRQALDEVDGDDELVAEQVEALRSRLLPAVRERAAAVRASLGTATRG